MNDGRDPIEDWLSADVELMPPPPGAFERVHRRAHHRRAMKAMTAAAGAAVVIAAGVVVPRFALTGPPTVPPNKLHSATAGPTPLAGALSLPGPPLSSAGHGQHPVARFRPTSVTFVNSSVGAVIGQAGTCGTGPCTAMAGTRDYGSSWTEVSAPPAGPADGSKGVSQVRSLEGTNIWAYGPGLYATHNGGRTWSKINSLPGRVIDLSTVGHRAFAVVASGCTGAGAQFAVGCTGFSLFSAAATSDKWHPVSGMTDSGEAVPGGLQLTSKRGYLIAGGRLYAGQVLGAGWHQVSTASPSAPGCLKQRASGPQLIAPTTRELFLACEDPATSALTLYRSDHSDVSWRRLGVVQATGAAQSLAVTPSGTLVLATSQGIYRSADGRSWNPVGLIKPTGGFSFVGMTTDSNGVAVAANRVPAVYVTTDGGRTWQERPIR